MKCLVRMMNEIKKETVFVIDVINIGQKNIVVSI